MLVVLAAVALLVPVALLVADSPALPQGWILVYAHDFRQGHAPNWFGWGNITLTPEGLELSPGAEYAGVYFWPFSHGPAFAVGARFQFRSAGDGTDHYTVQVMTRESEDVRYESGASLFFDCNQGVVRHMVNGTNEVFSAFNLLTQLQLRTWYELSFRFDGSQVKVELSGQIVYTAPAAGVSPNGYAEPHVAVFNGLALFESVWVEKPAATTTATSTSTTATCPDRTITQTIMVYQSTTVYQPYPVYVSTTATVTASFTETQIRSQTSTVWVAVLTETVTVTSTLEIPIPEQQGAGSFAFALALTFCVSLWMILRRKVRCVND